MALAESARTTAFPRPPSADPSLVANIAKPNIASVIKRAASPPSTAVARVTGMGDQRRDVASLVGASIARYR